MRIRKLVNGHGLRQKVMFALIRVLTGRRAVDIVRVLSYRPEFFGNAMRPLTQAVMRGPSYWSVGERELFAAFASRMQHCVF